MSDVAVLAMSTRRFWTMERQIARLMAERDLRRINVNRATLSQEGMTDVVDHLTRELGDTMEIHRERVVKPEKGFAERLTALSGKK